MTKTEVAKLVAVLLAAFPNAKASAQTSTVYETLLADLDADAAAAAVQRLIGTSRWMPTVAEIREAALAVEGGERRAGGDAWGDVLAEVHRTGRYRRPRFNDPLVTRAVTAFGWENICDSENQVADRARFVELYDQLAQTGRRERLTAQLPAVKAYRDAHPQLERGVVGNPFRNALRLVGGGDE